MYKIGDIHMRKLTDHIIENKPSDIVIEVTDEVGPGGAHHRYEITGFDTIHNTSCVDKDGYYTRFKRLLILFQKDVISKEHGCNGVTDMSLLAILIDRLRCFQNGEFACRENEIALTKLEEALHWLRHRTIERLHRGVDGKNIA